MTQPTPVSLELLRNATDVLLTNLAELVGPEVSVESDLYWSIPYDQASDVYTEPHELTIGQLSECVEHLQRVVDEPDTAVPYALVWLADVLRAVGHRGIS